MPCGPFDPCFTRSKPNDVKSATTIARRGAAVRRLTWTAGGTASRRFGREHALPGWLLGAGEPAEAAY